MQNLIKNLSQYGIGTQPQTENDFFKICEKENLGVIWIPDKFSLYFGFDGRGFIGLPRKICGLKLLFAMFHELGHHFAHAGEEPQVLWQSCEKTKEEMEADVIALIALMPKPILLDDSRFAHYLFNERIRLHFIYDI